VNKVLFRAIIVVYVLTSLVFFIAGVVQVSKVESGTRAVAKVDSCITTPAVHGVTYDCTGSWTVGGSLLSGGHVVVGTIEGATPQDVGKAIPVRVSGDTAYVRSSLATALVVIGLAVVMWLLPAWGLTRRARARRRAITQAR
jgi:hypothetical protein